MHSESFVGGARPRQRHQQFAITSLFAPNEKREYRTAPHSKAYIQSQPIEFPPPIEFRSQSRSTKGFCFARTQTGQHLPSTLATPECSHRKKLPQWTLGGQGRRLCLRHTQTGVEDWQPRNASASNESTHIQAKRQNSVPKTAKEGIRAKRL